MQDVIYPGSAGEHDLQEEYGTARKAQNFYRKQVLSYLSPQMQAFIAEREFMFVATADGHGDCDCTFRAGPRGFIKVIHDKLLAWPELAGNGVMASLGNISENNHVGLLMLDFVEHRIGLHINGKANIAENSGAIAMGFIHAEEINQAGRAMNKRPTRWVLVEVEEAYIHCSKNIPLLRPATTEEMAEKIPAVGDFFNVKSLPRGWASEAALGCELAEEEM